VIKIFPPVLAAARAMRSSPFSWFRLRTPSTHAAGHRDSAGTGGPSYGWLLIYPGGLVLRTRPVRLPA
jgi:hypothetical protein